MQRRPKVVPRTALRRREREFDALLTPVVSDVLTAVVVDAVLDRVKAQVLEEFDRRGRPLGPFTRL